MFMGIVMISLDGGLFDRPVHALDLSVGPGMVYLCQPVFDLMVCAHTVEDVFEGKPILLAIGEPDAIVGQDRVDSIRYGSDQMTQELGGNHLSRALMQFDIGELGCPVDGDKQPEFTFAGAQFGDVDMKISDRIALECLLWLVPFTLRQAVVPWRCKQRCSEDRVRCGIVGCSA